MNEPRPGLADVPVGRTAPIHLCALAVLGVLAALAAPQAGAVTLATGVVRTTEATIEESGAEVADDSQSIAGGPATSTVTIGALSDPHEARASGRALQLSMTANAEYDIRDFNFLDPVDFTGVGSRAKIELSGVSLGGDVTVDFFLPPGFLELRTQGEIGPGQFLQSASLSAELTFCSPTCLTGIATVFSLFATLEGDWFDQDLEVVAESQTFGTFPFGGPPSPLDVSALEHTNLDVVDSLDPTGIPLRTVTWEYPAFSGTVNVGAIPAGQPLQLIYELRADVSGDAPISGAAAAINDPFGITQFGPPSLDQAVAAPEPGATAPLVLGGLAALARARRRTVA